MSESAFDLKQKIIDLGDQKRLMEQNQDNYTLRKLKANLFMDDDSMIEFLASERFPNNNNAADKYVNIDGDLYYENLSGQANFDGKKYSKEFPDNSRVGFFNDTITPNLIPASTVGADIYGGMAGLKQGYKVGTQLAKGVPSVPGKFFTILGSSAVGAAGGTATVGGGQRFLRTQAIDSFYNLPPEEVAAQIEDLKLATRWGWLPFGTGTITTARLMGKFGGNREALEHVIRLRGDVQGQISKAKEFGIDITPAQASGVGDRARNIQFFLAQTPENQSIISYYRSQALQTSDAIRSMADKIGSSSGKNVDINRQLSEWGEEVIEQSIANKKRHATRIYDKLKNDPEGLSVPNMNVLIDAIDSKIAGEVLDKTTGKVIRTIKPADETIESLEQFKSMLYDENKALITDLMTLDARRTNSLKTIIKQASDTGGDQKILYGFKDDLTSLMDDASPDYALARRVYDPTKPPLQLIEKSVIGKFGKMMTDKQQANAVKNLFDPDVSIQSLRNARRVLQATNPVLLQDVKKQFILNQYDAFARTADLSQGMPRLTAYFSGNKVQRMMKEMLSPEEFDNFYRLHDVMENAFSVPIGAAQTAKFGMEGTKLREEAFSQAPITQRLYLAAKRLPSRLPFFSSASDSELTQRIAQKQSDIYFKAITDVLIDSPDATKSIDAIYDLVGTSGYATGQSIIKGGQEVKEILSEPTVQPYTGGQDNTSTEDLRKQIEALGNPQSMNTPPPPSMAPTTTDSSLRLGLAGNNPATRNIAMRQEEEDKKGIAGLV
tara:strand:+ start:1425 stop:3758 length:2334 start_codon:yes stop_codon:yes gene_type:complete